MLNSYLWFNKNRDEDESLDSILARALADYSDYYPGGMPDTCYIHSQQGPEGERLGVRLKHTKSVLPNHFWLGVDIIS